MPDGEAIEAGIVTRSIESAQRKVEARNFDVRKQLLEYDDVSNDQRKVIYQQRNDILEAASLTAQIANLREGAMTDVVRTFVPAESVEEQWDLPGLEKVLRDEWQLDLPLQAEVEKSDVDHRRGHRREGRRRRPTRRSTPRSSAGRPGAVHAVHAHGAAAERSTRHWREHLAALDYLRQGIHLRGYAQKNPKQEYKREAFELFCQLLDVVKMEVTRLLMTVRIQSQEEVARGRRGDRGARPSTSATSPTRIPNEDGSVSQEAGRRRCAAPGRRAPACLRRSAATIRAPAAAARSTSSATASWPSGFGRSLHRVGLPAARRTHGPRRLTARPFRIGADRAVLDGIHGFRFDPA